MKLGAGRVAAEACALPAGSAAAPPDFRLAFKFFALGLVATLLGGLADANTISDSLSQVGSWRVGAYTRGQTAIFDHCALYRVQGNGFGIAVGFTAKGIWSLAIEAPDWELTPNEFYATSIVVGTAAPYTFTGRAINARVMSLDVAPELYFSIQVGRAILRDRQPAPLRHRSRRNRGRPSSRQRPRKTSRHRAHS